MNKPNAIFRWLLAVELCLTGLVVEAQTDLGGRTWKYQLLEGSRITDDNLLLGRPTIELMLRGTFNLVFKGENPLYAQYELQDVAFLTDTGVPPAYQVTGQGNYQQGGEIALMQDLTLSVVINGQTRVLTNQVRATTRLWPVIEIDLDQADANPVQFYRLHLLAAPAREIWFSINGGLTSGNRTGAESHISGGDLISTTGRVVKRGTDLIKNLGFPATTMEYGLNAMDITAGGEVWFCLNQTVFSQTLKTNCDPGDILSERGKIISRRPALLTAFSIMPPLPEFGVDALHVNADGEILFSINTTFFSEKLGAKLGRGDILSNQGRIERSNQQLLARFQPEANDKDYGLDAFHIWPSGEIWFSTEDGFTDKQLGVITSGDIISDQGYLVFRNLELVNAFAPLEDLANFGLDSVFIVTDADAPAPPAQLTGISSVLSIGDINLKWAGKGRVFQVEKAGIASGPFLPLGPLRIESEVTDAGVLKQTNQSFYRVRQW